MRGYFTGVATAAILGGTILAGCSGGGGGPERFSLDPPPLGPTAAPEQTRRFTVPTLAAGDAATLVLTPVAGDEGDEAGNLYQVTTTDPGAVPASAPSGPSKGGPATRSLPLPCATQEGWDRVLPVLREGGGAGLAAAGAVQARVQGRWDELGAGAEEEIFRPLFSSRVRVRKMLDNAQTVRCNILAEVTDSPALGDTVIDAALALQIAQVFDSANPFDPVAPGAVGTHDRLTQVCGSYWNSNPPGGRDGDTRINLVFLSAANMSGALGLFYAGDALSNAQFPQLFSNEGEYLYINAEDLAVIGGTPLANASLHHTVAHELMHALQANGKLIMDGTFANLLDPTLDNIGRVIEHPTLAEGFAEAGATVCGFGLARAQDFTPTGGGDAVSCQYLTAYVGGDDPVTPGVTWDGLVGVNLFDRGLPVSGILQYGGGHLFGLHLIQRFGLTAWGRLTSSPNVGVANLRSNLPATPAEIFQGFNLALHGDALVGAPPALSFPEFAVGGLNSVRPTGSDLAPVNFTVGRAPMNGGTIDTSQRTQFTASPWTTVLLRIASGLGNPVTVEVNFPANAGASLIYESPAGTFSSVQ